MSDTLDDGRISPAALITPEFIESLSDKERLVIPYMFGLWLRPNQLISDHDWRYYGFVCGRGFGKSLAIAAEINRRVQCGEAKAIALMAPTEIRVEEVQINFLIATAPPWFRPERYLGGLKWPNGVQAQVFTPEAPGRSRSGNFDLVWMCEIVDWQAATRLEAYNNITTACRIGQAQVIWDTTSKGKNDVIQKLQQLHDEDPEQYPIQRGTTFDNPLLSQKYLASVCSQYAGRRYEEEILGMVFSESAGALWEQEWIDSNRVTRAPANPDLVIIGVDPALSADRSADSVGLSRCSRKNGEVYVEDDMSAQLKPEQWGEIVVDHCVNKGAAGCVIERNHLGDNATFVVKSVAVNHGYSIRILKKDKPFPSRTPGVIYVREVVSASSKGTRAGGPAAETKAGRVHIVGTLPDLEEELTMWEPGERRSPNRLDAFVFNVIELAGLSDPNKADGRTEVRGALEANRRLNAGILIPGRGSMGL